MAAFGRRPLSERKPASSIETSSHVSKTKSGNQDILVLKFGGSNLEDPSSVARSAEVVKHVVGRGFRVVVVVSALKGVTDSLLTSARVVSPKAPPEVLDEILSMGERTSARLFAAALSAVGLSTIVIDPDSEAWPIVTDANHQDANPLYEETLQIVRVKLLPLLEQNLVPVVCGYLGKTLDGRVTTLGRGGGDTTAVLLGSCLGAKEVILVKDVGAVFSSDPDQVAEPLEVPELDFEEAQVLSGGGGKFLHQKALRYLLGNTRLRIADVNHVTEAGTVIAGDLPELEVRVTAGQVTMISIVGNGSIHTEGLGPVVKVVREAAGKLLALTLEEKAVILYVHGGTGLLQKLHDLVRMGGLGKAITAFSGLALVEVRGRGLETSYGMIQRTTQPLARKGINIFGLVTISSSIRIFVDEKRATEAQELIRTALGVP